VERNVEKMVVDVIDLKFEHIVLQQEYDQRRKSRGIELYVNKAVLIQRVEKTNNNHHIVNAVVNGNRGFYRVLIELEGNVVEECECTCEDYNAGNVCKHILATCMEIGDPHNASTPEGKMKLEKQILNEIEERRREYELKKAEEQRRREYQVKYRNALKALDIYKGMDEVGITENDNKLDLKQLYDISRWRMQYNKDNEIDLATNVRIEPKIETIGHDEIGLNFKIGQTTMYVIKDMSEFYNAFLDKQTIQYGKKLKFLHERENISEESKKLLDLIFEVQEMVQYSKNLNNNSYYYRYIYESGKALRLIGNKIDKFFDVMKNIPISINSNRLKDKFFVYENKDIDIEIEVIKDNKDYKLKLNIKKYDYVSSNEYIYIFYNGKIYKKDKETNKYLLDIFQTFMNNDLLIPEDKIDEFSTYVLPKFEKYLKVSNLPVETAKQGLVVNKLASKILLDLDDKDNIMLELKFCYLDCEFNVLDVNHKKIIKEKNIIRNIPQEKEVLTRLFNDGFELVGGRRVFVLKDQDLTYEFLAEKIESYMNDFEVLVTDKFKNKKVRKTKISNVSIKLDSGLLELDISKIDIDIDEIKNVLKNYNIKKKYYKLKNGDFLNLQQSEDLEFLSEIQTNLDVNFNNLEKGIIRLPVNRSIYLEKILNNKTISTSKNDNFNKLVNNIDNKNFSDDIKIDEKFEEVLRDYQKVGYKWLKVLEQYKFGGILADDMGLGKTLQVITLIAESKEKNKTSIVICPSSLVLNWKNEIEKWCDNMKVLIIKGEAQTRKELINAYKDYDVIITSYDLLRRDVLEYEDKEFKYIIADEAQYIKNSSTQNATSLKSLNGEIRFALTGTPIENSISELWSIFDFIMPGYLYSYNKFKKVFEQPILKEDNQQSLQKLKTLINPFILRRIKQEVLTELPEKTITIMNNEMTNEQEKIYMSYFLQTKKEVNEELSKNGFEKSKFKILMLLTRLRQICCHPSLFIDNYKGESGKLNQCIDIITEAIESGHKILLFSSYTSMFEIIEEKLKEKNIIYNKLTGNTQVDKRVEMVEEFNKNENIKVFLISLKAGGTGLNLTGADVVIHYDPWWNVSSENQATDRAYRIGQKNNVQVYKLITNNSIEEKINKLQEKKAKISEQLLSTEETFINKLSKDEIMALFE